MTYLLLKVIGTREYRGHKVGDEFITSLDPALERGIERGNVEVIAEIDPSIRNREYGFPKDWPTESADEPLTERGGKK